MDASGIVEVCLCDSSPSHPSSHWSLTSILTNVTAVTDILGASAGWCKSLILPVVLPLASHTHQETHFRGVNHLPPSGALAPADAASHSLNRLPQTSAPTLLLSTELLSSTYSACYMQPIYNKATILALHFMKNNTAIVKCIAAITISVWPPEGSSARSSNSIRMRTTSCLEVKLG